MVAVVVVLVRDPGSPDPVPVAAPTPVTTSASPAVPSSSAPAPAPSTTAPPTFDRTQLSIDDPTSDWVVADKARPLTPLDYAPADLVPIGGHELPAAAARGVAGMVAAAAAGGPAPNVGRAHPPFDSQVNTVPNQGARF